MLPKGLEFLQLGWWLVHALAVLLVYSYAYRKGRGAERRAQRARELERGERPGFAPVMRGNPSPSSTASPLERPGAAPGASESEERA